MAPKVQKCIHHETKGVRDGARDGSVDRKFPGVGTPGFHFISFHSVKAEQKTAKGRTNLNVPP